ncbi:MAG: hypothetical protein K2H76_09500 [Muribaculaceae bacterium]|nr:hypothetical protein [Muribaculaceae bacterium]
MKTVFKSICLAAAIFILAACSGVGSYSPEKCSELKEKIKSKQELTESDYTDMVDQLEGIVNLMKEMEKEFGGDQEKEKEYAKTEEAQTLVKNFFEIGMYLDAHTDQLSNSQKKKINKIVSEFEKEKDKM